MHIHTSSNNTYSYLRRTNEIVSGIVEDEVYQWQFDPLASFSTMPDVYMYIIGLTEQCNLRCTYCCYSGEYKNNRSHGIHSMTQNDIDLILDFIQQETTQRPIRIAFYGGEPLLHFSLIEYAVKRGRERWQSEVAFSISTNGTLLTPEKVDWLVANNVELAISIDGTETFHNHNRVDSQGNGSYIKVYNALSYIKNTYPDYIQNIALQMTLPSFRNLAQIAKEWHKDDILKNIALSNIHGLSPNFNKGVEKVNYEQVKESTSIDDLVFHSSADIIINPDIIDGLSGNVLQERNFMHVATCAPDFRGQDDFTVLGIATDEHHYSQDDDNANNIAEGTNSDDIFNINS